MIEWVVLPGAMAKFSVGLSFAYVAQ